MTAARAQPADTEMDVPVTRSLAKGVLTLTLDRPHARNALSTRMMTALQSALDDAKDDRDVRVIVIAGEPPAFCAGHDMRELISARREDDGGRAKITGLMQQCARLMQSVVMHPRPVIADVRGPAWAAGCQLVASCDLALASSEATFGTPGVNIGLFCSTPMVALSRNVAPKHAMEMLLTGEGIGAQRAREIGLVNQVHAPADMDEAVGRLARLIASKSSMTLKMGKEAFYRQLEMPLADAYAYTAAVMVENMLKDDAREGISAFLEKREPQWRDE